MILCFLVQCNQVLDCSAMPISSFSTICTNHINWNTFCIYVLTNHRIQNVRCSVVYSNGEETSRKRWQRYSVCAADLSVRLKFFGCLRFYVFWFVKFIEMNEMGSLKITINGFTFIIIKCILLFMFKWLRIFLFYLPRQPRTITIILVN